MENILFKKTGLIFDNTKSPRNTLYFALHRYNTH
jgi:hypothetical protein